MWTICSEFFIQKIEYFQTILKELVLTNRLPPPNIVPLPLICMGRYQGFLCEIKSFLINDYPSPPPSQINFPSAPDLYGPVLGVFK